MKFYVFIIAVLLLNSSCRNSQALFRENTKDWKIYGDAVWRFSNNELIGSIRKGAGFIMTQEAYNDFILELEFKPDSTINSGVFIRCKNADINPVDCYEMNIWDLHPNQDYRTGAIVLKSVPLVNVETNNTWNTYKIKAKKGRIRVWINTILTADLIDNTRLTGSIGLQASGTGEIKFRNIKIKPLKID